MLETILLGIVQAEDDVQYAVVKDTMLKVAHLRGDVGYVVAMSMTRVIARKENKSAQGSGRTLSDALTFTV